MHWMFSSRINFVILRSFKVTEYVEWIKLCLKVNLSVTSWAFQVTEYEQSELRIR